ncbi:PEF-CTERM sorting domain-containing protein [Methanolobus sp. WCC4]|uniref:PEF-CTERM sorting domain-containing protein n=1 Tax=Methanolobus sp. WCC4 TaxID=3125784 RepID=UPI0030F84D3E
MSIKQNMIFYMGVALILLMIFTGNAAANGEALYNIILTQDTDTNEVGTSHTVTATLYYAGNNAGEDWGVTFEVYGFNPQTSGTYYTDGNGQASFTYTGNNAGVDTIVAVSNEFGTSNTLTKTWTPREEIPEFPTIALPVIAVIGIAFVLMRRRE